MICKEKKNQPTFMNLLLIAELHELLLFLFSSWSSLASLKRLLIIFDLRQMEEYLP